METSVAMRFLLIMLVVNEVVHNDVISAIVRRPDLCLGERIQTTSSKWTKCGEGHCRCTEDKAECPQRELKLVPRLPPGVRYLDVSIYHLSVLPENTLLSAFFSNASGITHLKLADCFTSFDGLRGSLMVIRNLTCLSLSLGFARSVPGYKRYVLMNIERLLSIPTLRQFACTNCFLDRWPEVNAPHIETLQLSSNPLGYVNYELEERFPNLRQVFLDDCSITSVYLLHLHSLRKIHLEYNLLREFQFPCFEDKNYNHFKLEHLNLSYNKIEHIGRQPACLTELKEIDISGNKLKDLASYRQVHGRNPVTNLTNPAKIPEPVTFLTSPYLRYLSVANNHMDFSIKSAAPQNVYTNFSFLQELILDGNDMSQVDDNRFMELFGYLTHLTTLSLRKCQLHTIFYKTLPMFSNLSILYLNENAITLIPDGAFDSLPSLSHLDLSGNPITTVSQDTFSEKTFHQLSSVYLTSKSFVCSCSILWFRQTLIENPAKFYPKRLSQNHRNTCGNVPKTAVEEFSMTEQACLLSREVSILIIMIITLIISTLTVVSLMFRFRWHLRLIIYEASRGRGGVMRLDHNHFDYDMFVSYDSEDFAWVHEQLVPKLENDMGLRLCIHERDFIPGKRIVDNIVDCVESSKKILMIFSKNFVVSQWCQFELTYCLRHVMDYDDALLVVCVDDVASRNMTGAMMAVMKTTTYIQWMENNADAVHSFWARMRLALNEILVYRY